MQRCLGPAGLRRDGWSTALTVSKHKRGNQPSQQRPECLKVFSLFFPGVREVNLNAAAYRAERKDKDEKGVCPFTLRLGVVVKMTIRK